MTSRSDCEPLPKPTLSPFALARPGTFLRVGFFTAAVWCVPALRVPLVHSLINACRRPRCHRGSAPPRGSCSQAGGPLQRARPLAARAVGSLSKYGGRRRVRGGGVNRTSK